MKLFGKKKEQIDAKSFDRENYIPVIKCSICTGEQVAGFQQIHTLAFEDVMLIKSPADLENFKKTYGVEGDLKKIY